jgi:hypothetical protein
MNELLINNYLFQFFLNLLFGNNIFVTGKVQHYIMGCYSY